MGHAAAGPWSAGTVEVVGHRGARGHRPENTVVSFLEAVRLGATALELDVQLSSDGVPVVWHDPVLTDLTCTDTAPAVDGDPAFPYLGQDVRALTSGQLATVDVGSRVHPSFPHQAPAPGVRIPLLTEVLHAVAASDDRVWFLVELKSDPTVPGLFAPPEELVAAVLAVVDAAGVRARVVLHSFDWWVVAESVRRAPDVPASALYVDGGTFAQGSAWLGPVGWCGGDVVAAVGRLGAAVLAPAWSAPYGATPADPGFRLVCDAALVARAHAAGLVVVPWTVNDEAGLAAVVAAGADGVVTDYPGRVARAVAVRGA